MRVGVNDFVEDPARNLLTVAQERRLMRLEEEDGSVQVVGYRRPRDADGADLEVGIVPIIRRPGGRRQAVLTTGRLSPVGAKRQRERR